MIFARILALLDIALFAIGGGITARAIMERRSVPENFDGLWKLAKAYVREPSGGWREDLGARQAFREFRDGALCVRYRVTPTFACERYDPYDPYTLQGNVLAIGHGTSRRAERALRRGSQLELVREEWRGEAWQETRREIYVRLDDNH